MEGQIKRRYPNYKQSGSFSGAAGFLKDSKLGTKLTKVRKVLRSIPSYALHHPVRFIFQRRRVYVSRMHEQYCMDLKDNQANAPYNNKKRYLLVVIDAFSKQAWLEAIPNKTAKVVLDAFKRIMARTGGVPSKIQIDEGKEFKNKLMSDYLNSNHI